MNIVSKFEFVQPVSRKSLKLWCFIREFSEQNDRLLWEMGHQHHELFPDTGLLNSKLDKIFINNSSIPSWSHRASQDSHWIPSGWRVPVWRNRAELACFLCEHKGGASAIYKYLTQFRVHASSVEEKFETLMFHSWIFRAKRSTFRKWGIKVSNFSSTLASWIRNWIRYS
jgi:hypothetical protein